MNIAAPHSCYASSLPSVEQALAIIAPHFTPVRDAERLPLHRAAGRVLAEDVVAAITMPPWDRSAMDGFAFQAGTGHALRLTGRAAAGEAFAGAVRAGECIAISTGAVLPQGCNTVAMHERCIERQGRVHPDAVRPGANVRKRGEDFRSGDSLATAGTKLDARHVALLASASVADVAVKRRLRIAVLSTGDELGASAVNRVFDANRAMLMALCRAADVDDLGILPDRRDVMAAALCAAAAGHDIVIGSGGTSEGDEDNTRGALQDCGGDPLVAGVAIKPGKPVAFGRIGNCLHIALPGNPAAALVTFLALGAPLLRHLSGERAPAMHAGAARTMFAHTKKRGVREYLRVTLSGGPDGMQQAHKGDKNGSAMLLSLALSDGLVCLDEAMTEIAPGTILPCRSFAELFSI